jgi:hypothetical protein
VTASGATPEENNVMVDLSVWERALPEILRSQFREALELLLAACIRGREASLSLGEARGLAVSLPWYAGQIALNAFHSCWSVSLPVPPASYYRLESLVELAVPEIWLSAAEVQALCSWIFNEFFSVYDEAESRSRQRDEPSPTGRVRLS